MTVVHGHEVLACRSCGSPDPRRFLDLGATPIANALLPVGADFGSEGWYPLAGAFCEACSLVQLAFELPAGAIFDQDYPYYSSVSAALCAHAKTHADNLLTSRGLDANSLVVELASNDGYLLTNFVTAGVPVLGIDPSPGPARDAEAKGVPTMVDFFGAELAAELRAQGRVADVIIANNVMAHVPDLNGFVEGMSILLADDGLITIENPYVRELIENVEFDTIYHEHFCYFSCLAVDALMRRHGLHLNDVEMFPNLHGGTLRWYVGKVDAPTDRARTYLTDERRRGMDTFRFYETFSETARTSMAELRKCLSGLKSDGRSIAAYGAAAKGATLLNATGIGSGTVDFVVDRNEHKQNHLMPGVHIPILGVEAIAERTPDYLLLLAWNFKDEIMGQQAAFAAKGGKFIIPLPHPTIV